MKIDGTPMSPIRSVQGANRAYQVQKKTQSSEGDNVAVSDKAQLFQALLQKAKELPSIREDRVQALREQIERGEFQIDVQKIAEKIVTPEF